MNQTEGPQNHEPVASSCATVQSIVRRCGDCGSTDIVCEPVVIGPQLPQCHPKRCRELVQPFRFHDPYDPNDAEKFDRCFYCGLAMPAEVIKGDEGHNYGSAKQDAANYQRHL